jgi:hypothetical protein
MAQKSDINYPLIVAIAVLSTLLLIVSIIGVDAWFHGQVRQETDLKDADAPNRKLVELRTEQNKHLQQGIGIEEAMNRVVKQRGSATTQAAKGTVQP